MSGMDFSLASGVRLLYVSVLIGLADPGTRFVEYPIKGQRRGEVIKG